MSEQTDIAYNNYDIIFRNMTAQFKEKVLDFYGIRTAPIVRVEATDLPTIAVNDRRMDFLFLLADDTYLHLEFQTTFDEKDLDRFLQYDVSAYERYKKPIKTVVIYGADVEKVLEQKSYGSVQYEAQAVLMKKYNGDAIIQNLWAKVENGEELTDLDELHLIFLPLMRSSLNRSERAIETVEIAKRIKNEEKQVRLLATIIAVSDKFIDKEYVEKLMEVLSMARVIRMAEERARINESQQAIKKYLSARLGLESKPMQNKVDLITDLYLLHHLLDDLYRAEKKEEMDYLIDVVLEKQKNMG
ncbi:hypothetical protein [Anoxybacillus flavithermus]|uniref:hypothetical protein n=1 Tax=Anoxybacillus flavithermus TaxID=33934 RepID=UPI000AC81DC4|nr:hypothetical protein [Anoxybacillus flavithermus]